MCIYVHIYMDAYPCIHMYRCGYCVYLFTHEFVFVYYVYMCTSVYVCILTCMCLCACFGVLYRIGRRPHHLPQERNNDREERERQRKECIKIFLDCGGLENSVLNLTVEHEIFYGNCR